MNGTRKAPAPPATGGASLMMIFTVLCITVFSVLSLATAQADVRIAERSRNAAMAYYDADEEIQFAIADLRTGKIPDGAVPIDGSAYEIRARISDDLDLYAYVRITDGDCRIIEYRTDRSRPWEPVMDMPVWTGE